MGGEENAGEDFGGSNHPRNIRKLLKIKYLTYKSNRLIYVCVRVLKRVYKIIFTKNSHFIFFHTLAPLLWETFSCVRPCFIIVYIESHPITGYLAVVETNRRNQRECKKKTHLTYLNVSNRAL